MLLQQVPAVPKEYVDLLIWIIGISFSVIIILAGVIVYLHKDSRKNAEQSITHIGKTNSVLENISVSMKEGVNANMGLKESIKDLHGVINAQNDYLPKIINALRGKEI